MLDFVSWFTRNAAQSIFFFAAIFYGVTACAQQAPPGKSPAGVPTAPPVLETQTEKNPQAPCLQPPPLEGKSVHPRYQRAL
jgi:hypothetical protein